MAKSPKQQNGTNLGFSGELRVKDAEKLAEAVA